MTGATIISISVGAAATLLSIASQLSLWQRKEYRWDRLRSFMSSPAITSWLWPWPLLAAVATDAAWLAYIFGQTSLAEVVGQLALASFAWHHAWRGLRAGVLRPKFTPKVLLITAVAVLASGVYLVLLFEPAILAALQLSTLLVFTPVIVAGSVGLVAIPTSWRKHQLIRQARAKRQWLASLQVIGITGSFGKTSTKHFLHQLLAGAGQRAAVTEERRNSDFTVALDMMQQLSEHIQTYIVEMGAYRRGEIAAVAKLTRPIIGLITTIGNQHVDLFGSMENIGRAKWELIDALPPDGTAVLNADDPAQVARATSLKQKIIWYSTSKPADVFAGDVTVKPLSIELTMHIGRQSQHITIPLVSAGLLQSAIGAAAAAWAVGVSAKQLFAGLAHLRPFAQTMEPKIGPHGSLVIDDGYSANEVGVINALTHMARLPQTDKRIVLMPIIELGKAAPAVHERIGRALGDVSGTVYLGHHLYRRSIQAGARRAQSPARIQYEADVRQLAKTVSAGLSKDSVILLEGRVPDVVRRALL